MAAINQKDLEAISAYIDQALSPQARAKLEERLKNEPELLAELNSMRRTRRILRSTPAYKAPRNFTLTPEMVSSDSEGRSWFFPFTRYAFALAGIFFVFTLVGNYMFSDTVISMSQDVAAPPEMLEMAVEEAPMAESAAEGFAEDTAAGETVIAIEEVEMSPTPMPEVAPDVDVEAMESEPTEEAAQEEAEDLASDAASTTDVAESPVAEMPSGGGGPTQEPTPVPEVAPTIAAAEDEVAAMPAVEEGAVDDGEGEVADTTRTSTEDETIPDAVEDIERVGFPPVEPEVSELRDEPQPAPNYWLIAAAISGFVALVSGAASLYLRRK